MTGLEVLHWIRRTFCHRQVAVYLLTSSEAPEHKRQATAHGVTEYVLKALSLDILIHKLDRLIAMSNQQGIEAGEMEAAGPEIPTQGLTNFSQD